MKGFRVYLEDSGGVGWRFTDLPPDRVRGAYLRLRVGWGNGVSRGRSRRFHRGGGSPPSGSTDTFAGLTAQRAN